MSKSRGKTGDTQHTQRIFTEGIRNVTQQALFDIALSVIGVDKFAIFAFGDRIDGQITSHQILFQRDVRRGITGETVITGT